MSGVNRMRDVASLLGVKFREEFNVIGNYEEYNPHYFTRYGITDKDGVD